MKKQYSLRKEWEKIAKEMGMKDAPQNVIVHDPATKTDKRMLVNNYRRFVKGMSALDLTEQKAKLKLFYERMETIKADQTKLKEERFKVDLPKPPAAPGAVPSPEEKKPDWVI